MKKTNKKGFTIVELVIVIAVIAILAAVLVPNISRLVKKANESSDLSLVRNLNTALAVENTTYATAYEAFEAVKEAGYDLTKIEAKASDNKILFDSANQCFAYLDGSDLKYYPNSTKSDTKTPDHQLWAIVTDKDEAEKSTYSVYWNGEDNAEIKVNGVGFDAGNKAVATVTCDGNNEVIVRTNAFTTKVTIKNATVNHYGQVETATVESGTYHEFGAARVVTLTTGTANVEAGANVTLLNAKAGTVTIKGTVEALANPSNKVTVNGTATFTTTAAINENTVAVIGNEAKATLAEGDFKGNTVILLQNLTDKAYNLSNCTVIGNMTKLKAIVKSGDVTLKNIYTTYIGVGEEETWSGTSNNQKVDKTGNFGKNFDGTLTFDGGMIDSSNTGTMDADAPLFINSGSGTYIFKNMTLSTGVTKGLKIKAAKSVTVENCVFDAKGLTSGAQGNEWETRSLSAIDIDISGNADKNMSVTIKGCTFSNIPFSSTTHTECTAGAIKIKSQKNNLKFDSVVIENNTFINCCRDIVIGKAGDNYYKLTFDGQSSAKWTIKNNQSTLTADSIKDIDVKTGVSETTKIGKMVGGCAVFDVADAHSDDKATYAVRYN